MVFWGVSSAKNIQVMVDANILTLWQRKQKMVFWGVSSARNPNMNLAK